MEARVGGMTNVYYLSRLPVLVPNHVVYGLIDSLSVSLHPHIYRDWLNAVTFSPVRQWFQSLLALKVINGFLWRLSKNLHPVECGAVCDTVRFREPSKSDARSVVVYDVDVVPSIFGLNLSGRPAAIRRFVMSVAVNAIKRASDWPIPHVSEERREVVLPLGAHGDSPSSVVSKVLRGSAEAPLLSLLPHRELRGVTHSVRQPALVLQLDTTAALEELHGARVTNDDVAAFALNTPRRYSRAPAFNREDSQPIESLSGYIHKVAHAEIIQEAA
jgi:hypothetical protein